MRSLNSLSFDSTGLTPQENEGDARVWLTADGDRVTLYCFSKPPPMSAAPHNLDRWRAWAREGGRVLVELEPLTLDGCAAIREIVKVPQSPFGMGYLGSLMLPFRDFGYMVAVACREHGVTGQRDTIIFAELIQAGEVRFEDGAEQPTGWMADPYDPAIKTPPGRNRSDDAAYDARFPDHPLSRLRRLLARIEGTTRLSAEVKSEAADW